MKLQYASDIHLEFCSEMEFQKDDDFAFLIEPTAPILVLAGDIATTTAPLLPRFLQWVSKSFKHTIWIMGNHEYYSPKEKRSMNECLNFYRSLCSANVHILDNETLELDDVLFVGTTLWSRISDDNLNLIRYRMNDHRIIYYKSGIVFQPEHMNLLFEKNLKFLSDTLAQHPSKKIVLITHHVPITHETSAPEYEGQPGNEAFATEITLKDESNIVLWICGHTHHNFRIKRGTYEVVSNQLGYHGEHTGWDYRFGFEIDV